MSEKSFQIPDAEDDYDRFLAWKSAHLHNERKFLSWIRTSIALITLGFIVERFSLYLATISAYPADGGMKEPDYITLLGLAFFFLGALIILVATWEFFADRRRINGKRSESTLILDVLILAVLVFLMAVSVTLAL